MRLFIAVTAALALCLAAGAFAQTYTVLHEFGAETPPPDRAFPLPVEDDGTYPMGSLVSDGTKLFGVTEGSGGYYGGGTVFSMNLDGSAYTVLHSFDEFDDPTAGLALAGGCLYGTTEEGGDYNGGMIYKIDPNALPPDKSRGPSAFSVIYSFPASAWWGYPDPSPLVASGNTLYGQLLHDTSDYDIYGVVYSIQTDGTGYTVLTTFSGEPDDGEDPHGRLLLEGGSLYGATMWGGKYYADAGTLFSLPAAGGAHTNLHEFSGTDGFSPVGGLVSDGTRLYGLTGSARFLTASAGKTGISLSYGTAETVFAVDKGGANFTTLHRFSSDTSAAGRRNDSYRSECLVTGLARDGDSLYGTNASEFGRRKTVDITAEYDAGTIFTLKTDGTGYTALYQFDGLIGGTGSVPVGTLLLVNGTLYGATRYGGTADKGVVYSFTLPPPAPFIPIDLTPSRTTFFTTDYIAVRANISAIDTPCVPFVRIIRPDGGAYYFVQGRGFTEAPTPFLDFPGIVTVPAAIGDYPVFDTLFRGMPIGTYVLEGGALDATRTTDLLDPVYIGTVDREELIVQ